MTNAVPPKEALILILDDDHFLADMYSVKFIQHGFTVETFDSVKNALAALRSGKRPVAVLFDIVMPDLNGFDFLRTAKEEKLGEGAVYIALTNQSSDTDRAQAETLGVDSYVIKASLIPSEVVTMVANLLEKKKSSGV